MAGDQAAVTVAPRRLWLARSIWAAVALLTGIFLQAFFQQPVGWPLALGLFALLVLTAFRPYEALLLLASLGPLSAILFILSGSEARGLRLFEAMTLAFLTGWAAGRAVRPRPFTVGALLRWSATLLGVAALASAVISGAVLLAELPEAGETKWVISRLARDYPTSWNPVSFAMLLVEGLLLLLAVADIWAGDPRKRDGVVRMMVAGAAAAAAFNVLRIVMVSLQREHPWDTFLAYFVGLRVNVHHADLNAAGSYFGMVLLMAFGLRARERGPAMVCSLFIAAGLWMSGSRTALAAVCVMAALAVGIALRARAGNRLMPLVAGVALLAMAAAAGWVWYPHGRNLEAGQAFSYRIELAKAAFKLTAAEPVFGVGVGGFYDLSGHRENAHNNFLQILAELGIPGLALFLSTIAFAVRDAFRSISPPLPLLAGIGTFLLTCLAGHPLLVPAAAYPFWIALGLTAAPHTATPVSDRRLGIVALALIVLCAAALPFRMDAAVRRANLEGQASGLSKWQHEPDGSRYRWAGGRSSFFVESSARAIRIPLRHDLPGAGPLEIRIFLNGREANRIMLQPGGEWQNVRLLLARDDERAFSRIDLEAGLPGTLTPLDVQSTDLGGVMMVGRPIIEP